MNRLVLLAFVVFSTTICSGQSSRTFSFQAHAGLSGTQVQGDGLGGFDKIGVMVGLGIESQIKLGHSLGFEINLLQKGSKKNADPENGDYEKYKMTLTYVQVPLYFNYHFTKKISALAGPAIGLLVSVKEEDLNGEIESNPDFNSVELSGILGVQYWISDRFRAEVRFDQSLLPIRTKDTGTSRFLIGKQYNTSLGVYACFTIK